MCVPDLSAGKVLVWAGSRLRGRGIGCHGSSSGGFTLGASLKRGYAMSTFQMSVPMPNPGGQPQPVPPIEMPPSPQWVPSPEVDDPPPSPGGDKPVQDPPPHQ